MLSDCAERIHLLQAWLFPQRVYLELQDQAITAMVLDGRRLTWLDQLTLPPGLCVGGRRQGKSLDPSIRRLAGMGLRKQLNASQTQLL